MAGQGGFATTVTTTAGALTLQIRSFSGPASEGDDIDVTHYGSPALPGNPNSGFREYVMGLVDPGEAEIEAVYHPQGAIDAYAILGTTGDWVIDLGTHEITFSGHLSGLAWEIPYDDAVMLNGTLKVSGLVDFGVVT